MTKIHRFLASFDTSSPRGRRDHAMALCLVVLGLRAVEVAALHLQLARLRLPAACIEDLDFRSPRGLDKSLILRLVNGQWKRDHQVVLISGATGTGKSFLACALGHGACRHGLSTRYFRLSRLLGDLTIARVDGSYTRALERLARTTLLIIDDFGLAPLKDSERRDLLEVLEDRYGRLLHRCSRYR